LQQIPQHPSFKAGMRDVVNHCAVELFELINIDAPIQRQSSANTLAPILLWLTWWAIPAYCKLAMTIWRFIH